MTRNPAIGRVPITGVRPMVGYGRRLAKAVVGKSLPGPTATFFGEGHDAIAADLVLRDPAGRPAAAPGSTHQCQLAILTKCV